MAIGDQRLLRLEKSSHSHISLLQPAKEMKHLTSRILTLLSLLACLNFLPDVLVAQPFSAVPMVFPSFSFTKLDWGDFDTDGDLDILIAGSNNTNYYGQTKLLRNDGLGFTAINTNLLGATYGDLDWGDYDNDGDLDIAIVGYTNNSLRISKIYRNNTGGFQDINAGLPGLFWASVKWGDMDNDGDLDLVMQGADSTQSTKVYRNDHGTFVDSQATLMGLSLGTIALGDYDADGDLDIFSAGVDWNNSTQICHSNLYRNDEGVFTRVLSQPIVNLRRCSAEWGDYDNDGDLDLALVGEHTDAIKYAKVYTNNNGNFSTIQNVGDPVSLGAISWGDYDNDGDPDLLSCGYTGSPLRASTKVLTNNSGFFVWDSTIVLDQVYSADARWGDFDKDDDLDIFLSGQSGNYHRTRLYRNDVPVQNTAPDVPIGLTGLSQGGNAIRFSWSAPLDAETPSPGLSYRLWIGTAMGAYDISSPTADTATGWRQVAAPGNLKGTAWTLRNVQIGQTYFAAVSAIDAGFKGSAFSPKISVTALVAADGSSTQPLLVSAGPNPTNGMITIQPQFELRNMGHYRLMRLTGQTMEGFSGEWNGKLSLDLSGLPSATYLLVLDAKELGNPTAIRIVKE